jgi:hypothetical protein
LDIPFESLYRLCEKAHYNRHSACPLFWTIGCQQVGKAAISGWKDLLSPAFEDHPSSLKIWPFPENFQQIIKPSNIVVVETYPAEFYRHLGLSFSGPERKRKRSQEDRKEFSSKLSGWALQHNLDLDDSIIEAGTDGFGAGL